MSSVPAISVVILTYNEEQNVRIVLDSVRWCDNVVVIDSYSKDDTPQICRSHPNVTFIQHEFTNFAEQRQYALECGCVKHDWVLALDADEQVPPELRDELIQICRNGRPEAPVAYDIAMRIVMWGKWLKYSSEYPVYWRRFIRADRCRFVQEGHSDKVVTDGRIGRTNHDLIHADRRGLEDWLAKHNQYTSLEADYALGPLREVPLTDLLALDRARRRRALKRLFRMLPCNALVRFIYLYFLRLGFLDGRRGFDFCLLRAFQHFIIRLKIRERRALENSRAAE